MQIRIHPKSLPVTKGWSKFGPPARKFRAIPKRELSKAFRDVLNKVESPRVRKLRHKIAQGELGQTEAILGYLDVALAVRPPKEVRRAA